VLHTAGSLQMQRQGSCLVLDATGLAVLIYKWLSGSMRANAVMECIEIAKLQTSAHQAADDKAAQVVACPCTLIPSTDVLAFAMAAGTGNVHQAPVFDSAELHCYGQQRQFQQFLAGTHTQPPLIQGATYVLNLSQRL